MAVIKEDNDQAAKANKKTISGEIITDTREEDILCGKEKHCVSHPGSLNFRAIIDKYACKYQEAITKQEKMNVTKEIYDNLGAQNSRFLKWNAASKGWEELSSLLARDKISHALRFANREKKSPSKPKSKKGHRRTGSDSSAATLSTVATELSIDDFECLLNDEPLEWNTDPSAPIEDEPKPYAYPIYDGYESTPAPPAYAHPSYGQPYYSHPHPHNYGPSYYHPQNYHYPHHSYPHPQHHYAPAPVPMPQPHHHHYHQYEEPQPMPFPEKPAQQAPTRESSMDVDLSYLVSEPLMDWELEPEQVCMVNDQ